MSVNGKPDDCQKCRGTGTKVKWLWIPRVDLCDACKGAGKRESLATSRPTSVSPCPPRSRSGSYPTNTNAVSQGSHPSSSNDNSMFYGVAGYMLGQSMHSESHSHHDSTPSHSGMDDSSAESDIGSSSDFCGGGDF